VCRLRLETVSEPRFDAFGSFFDPERAGWVYALPADRSDSRVRAGDRPGWSYDGPTLRPRLREIARVRILVERARGELAGQPFAWTTHRGLVLTGRGGEESLLLAEPDYGEAAAFLPALGAYRGLLDPAAPVTPGAGPRELLGHGDREGLRDVGVVTEPPSPVRDA
jgi:hypothetical protein